MVGQEGTGLDGRTNKILCC